MDNEHALLRLLNDGEFHSDEALAAKLAGVGPADVGRLIRRLERQGIQIQASPGQGYRLAEPLEFLDKTRIEQGLDANAREFVAGLEIHPWLESTNTHLMDRASSGLAGGSICFAERQTSGRGRLGRVWVSPHAANLYMSLLWRFAEGGEGLSCLSLATGVAAARALEKLGVSGVGLKWPNDLLWRRRKLGGILLEFGGSFSGPCHVVAGIGLNVAMPEKAAMSIDQPWVDLRGIGGSATLSRNRLAAGLVSELVTTFARFEQQGFEAIGSEWRRFDQVAGQRVHLKLPDETVTGVVQGIDRSGALILETADGVTKSFVAGEISLRFQK
jgi:BirA family biotin operon repressor/biotin-[acetyl-CoA-carboxylase] ligase